MRTRAIMKIIFELLAQKLVLDARLAETLILFLAYMRACVRGRERAFAFCGFPLQTFRAIAVCKLLIDWRNEIGEIIRWANYDFIKSLIEERSPSRDKNDEFPVKYSFPHINELHRLDGFRRR